MRASPKSDSYGFMTTERGGRRRKPLPHCGCTVPCQRSFTCPRCQQVHPYCFGAGEEEECIACWGAHRNDVVTRLRKNEWVQFQLVSNATCKALVSEGLAELDGLFLKPTAKLFPAEDAQ
jgi:hypothetical protein